MYSILANLAFKKFAESFTFETVVESLSIDDHTRSGYSHTALLNQALKSHSIRPCYGKMRARNSVSYSGKNYEFRRSNPRDFIYRQSPCQEIILVDDIITTGTTLGEAAHCVTTQGKTVLFCLTLADVAL
jgi:competence protein ComFC